MTFRDRIDAGRQLASQVSRLSLDRPIVLALPRGGVPVAAEVARALSAPLDVFIVRKIGAPSQPELALGALSETGSLVRDRALAGMFGVTESQWAELQRRTGEEVAERVATYRGGQALPPLHGRTVVLVDDGIATGSTVEAALTALREFGVRKLVLAVPVAAPQALARLQPLTDEVVCLTAPARLSSVGQWYDDFSQTEDDEVLAILEQLRGSPAPQSHAEEVRIRAGEVVLDGELTIPEHAMGLVLFAHGSGSGRRSPRNLEVARKLQRAGLATLLFDLLSAEEAQLDTIDARFRFDIELLGRRLASTLEWVGTRPDASGFAFGVVGSSTGAAAALIAAAERPDLVNAVVSRGGRGDLARPALPRVQAPTLLIVGGADPAVLELNKQVLALLGGPARLDVVPGATHLFEETGALEAAAQLAAEWFRQWLVAEAEQRPAP